MIHLTQEEYESLVAARKERDRLRAVLQKRNACCVGDALAFPVIAGLLVLTAVLERVEMMPRWPSQRPGARRP